MNSKNQKKRNQKLNIISTFIHESLFLVSYARVFAATACHCEEEDRTENYESDAKEFDDEEKSIRRP